MNTFLRELHIIDLMKKMIFTITVELQKTISTPCTSEKNVLSGLGKELWGFC